MGRYLIIALGALCCFVLGAQVSHWRPGTSAPEPLEVQPMPLAADPDRTPTPSSKLDRLEIVDAQGRAVIIFTTAKDGRPVAQVKDADKWHTIDLGKVARLSNRF